MKEIGMTPIILGEDGDDYLAETVHDALEVLGVETWLSWDNGIDFKISGADGYALLQFICCSEGPFDGTLTAIQDGEVRTWEFEWFNESHLPRIWEVAGVTVTSEEFEPFTVSELRRGGQKCWLVSRSYTVDSQNHPSPSTTLVREEELEKLELEAFSPEEYDRPRWVLTHLHGRWVCTQTHPLAASV